MFVFLTCYFSFMYSSSLFFIFLRRLLPIIFLNSIVCVVIFLIPLHFGVITFSLLCVLIYFCLSSRTPSCYLLLLLLLLTSIEFSPGGSSPYTSTDKTNKNKMYLNETKEKNGTNNTKHSRYKYTYYKNTHTVVKTPTHYGIS